MNRRKGKTEMSPQKIEMHFTEIMHLAARLRELSGKLKSTSENKVMQIACENRACWNSECADIVVQKEVKISGQLVSEAENLAAIAEEMESQARKMYQSEMFNYQLAATRIYHQF